MKLNNLIYKTSNIYFALGILSTLITVLSLDSITYTYYSNFINPLQGLILFIATSFFCINLWPERIKVLFLPIIWHLSIFIIFGFTSIFLVLISTFSHLSLINGILNLIMIGMLLNWQVSLVIILLGTFSAYNFYEWYIGGFILSSEFYDLKIKIIYILFASISFLLAFLKPKQEQQMFIEAKVAYLDHQIHNLEDNLIELTVLREEFLRNIQHESRTPITGTVSMAQTLWECYDKLPKERIIKNLKVIGQSSHRLETWANNLYELAKLNSLKAKIKFNNLNLSNLIYERIEFCCKLYLSNKHELEFVYEIEEDIFANLDVYYIKQIIDNLIINALQYNKKGKIVISLKKEENQFRFSISDEGIGIPNEEINDVFAPFTVSSRTKTPAGGRGIGLTLCKKVVEVHQGNIWAENNLELGVTFTFTMPTNLKIPNFEKDNINIPNSKIAQKFIENLEYKIKSQLAASLLSQGIDLEVIKEVTGLTENEIMKTTI